MTNLVTGCLDSFLTQETRKMRNILEVLFMLYVQLFSALFERTELEVMEHLLIYSRIQVLCIV